MKDRYAKLNAALQQAFGNNRTLPLVIAQVKAITGESCTVDLGGLELTEVRLKATINGSGDKLMMLPKVGSSVLIGSLTGDLKDLAVLRIDELEKIQYDQGGLKIEVDTVSGKVAIKNDTTSFKDLFQQMVDIWNGFKVTTPNGPSSGLLPDTTAAIKKFESDFKTLLK